MKNRFDGVLNNRIVLIFSAVIFAALVSLRNWSPVYSAIICILTCALCIWFANVQYRNENTADSVHIYHILAAAIPIIFISTRLFEKIFTTDLLYKLVDIVPFSQGTFKILLIFFLICVSICALPFAILITATIHNTFFENLVKQDLSVKQLTNNKKYYLLISLLSFFLLLAFSNKNSFWYDELAQIGFIKDDLKTVIDYSMSLTDGIPPLFSILAYYWYSIVHNNETLLYLITIAAYSLSVYIVALIAEKVGGKNHAILASSMFAFAGEFPFVVGLEFRAYALLVFFSTLSLYCYILKNERNRLKDRIAYAASIVFLCFIHYFGIIIIGLLFISDLILLIKKKINTSFVLVYIPAIVFVLTWMAMVYLTVSKMPEKKMLSWQEIPGLLDIFNIYEFLSGRSFFLVFLCIASIFIMLYAWTNKEFTRDFSFKKHNISLCVFLPIANILIVFIYGHFINNDVTMWSPRYFYGLVPYVIVTISYIISILLESFFSTEKYKLGMYIAIFILLITTLFSGINYTKLPYREAVNYLNKNASNNDKAILLTTDSDSVVDGCREMYVRIDEGSQSIFNKVFYTKDFEKINFNDYNRVYYMQLLDKDMNVMSKLENNFGEAKNVDDMIYIFER